MSVSRIIHCDGPDCRCHVQTASPPPYIPGGFIESRVSCDNADDIHHFCSWDCAMKYGATTPAPVVIKWPDPDQEGER